MCHPGGPKCLAPLARKGLRKFISENRKPRRGLWRKVAEIKVESNGGAVMDVRERYQSAMRTYDEWASNPTDYRLLENTIHSLDTVPEHLALHQLGHADVSRKVLNEAAQKIRREHSSLEDLHSCNNTVSHTRNIIDRRGGKFTTNATSTGIDPNNQETWYVGGKYLPTVVHDAAATLKSFPELNQRST
jgi:hypothetical protein